jgi:hypothetical protein
MKVISKKSSKKLLKGAVYVAESFNNTTTGQRWTINRIRIQGFGTYMCKDFIDENGNNVSTNLASISKELRTLNKILLKKNK